MSTPEEVAILDQWSRIVGPENVVTEECELRAAGKATYETGHRIPAIVRPADCAQVQECMRTAHRAGVAVYPVSTGKNWGYGSRVPASDGCVLLDLGRMNRIVGFSEELAYVTVEPGVTQKQLHAFLRERQSALWMDATGSSPDCSLIGNAVERGFGHTPYSDHFANSCGLQVVLADGEVIDTGFSRFPSAHAGPLFRWGVGPSLDGLFSQSNFGIVTCMTIWLMPAPEYFQAYYFRTESSEGLSGLIDALRPLRLNGTIRSASHIANDFKVLSALQQYPWHATDGRTPLPGPLMDQFRKELKIGVWNGSGALYGTKAQVREARRLLRRALRGKVSRLQFVDDRKLRFASVFAKASQLGTGWNLARMLAVLRPVYGLMKGIPTERPLASTYWRKIAPPPLRMDPDRDGCGLLWCSPVAPNDGFHAQQLTGLATDLLSRHGFEPMISVTVLTDRTLSCVISISYDRDVPGEDQRAIACHAELLGELGRMGYYTYRASIGSMSAIMGPASAYTRLLRKIKDAVDPAGVLAPGRYECREPDRVKSATPPS